MSHKLMRIYLRDQLALSVAFEGLARRCRASNPDGELGELLTEIEAETKKDTLRLQDAMSLLGVTKNRFKVWGAALAVRLGRLKLNGNLVRYSDLSRLYELEVLCVAFYMKRHMWETVHDLSRRRAAEVAVTASQRIAVVAQLRERLETHRLSAVEALR